MLDNKLDAYIIFGILAFVAWFMFRAIPTEPLSTAEMDRLTYALAQTKRDLSIAESEARTADSVLRLAQDVARRRVRDAKAETERALQAARDSSVATDSLRGHIVTLGLMVGALAQDVDSLNAHIDTVREAVDRERVLRITAQVTADSAVAAGRTALAQTECRIGPLRCPSRGAVLGLGIAIGILIPLIR